MTTFSVLICTYNRPELLQKALTALLHGTTEPPDQVVIVNGGDERAVQIVEEFVNTPDIEIKLIKTTNKNLATSRNIGLPYCTGDIVAMTDDDAQVFPDWVIQMKRAHAAHPEAGAVGGPVLGTNTESLVGKVADLITFPSGSEPHYVRTLPGVNVSYKWEAVEKAGLQDESLFRGEDVDYNWRIKQLGYEILFDPAIKVYHHHRPTVGGFLNQHYMYGRAYYLVRRKWPEMYCIYPHRLRRPKDMLKGLNFIASPFYQPFLSSRRIPEMAIRLQAIPLLFFASLAWQGGMLVQAFKEACVTT